MWPTDNGAPRRHGGGGLARVMSSVGVKIRDRAFYDTQHDTDEDRRHVADMERDALYLLEGIRRRDQENPGIAQEIDGHA